MRSAAAALLGAPLIRHEMQVELSCLQLLLPSPQHVGVALGSVGDKGAEGASWSGVECRGV